MLDIRQLIQSGRSAFLAGDLETYRTATRLTAKVIRDLAVADRVDDALNLEAVWYQHLVKQMETEENYFEAFRWHTEALFSAGSRLRRATTNLVSPDRIAFIVPNGVLLGHTQVLLKILREWRARKIPVQPVVISLTHFSDELAAPLRSLDVEMRAAGSGGAAPSTAILWCRDVIAQLGCGTAVWVSVPIWASYALGMRLAAKQVLWSLKFHPVHLGDEVKHVAMTPPGEGSITIHGKEWSRFSPPLTIGSKRRTREEIAALKNSFGGRFLFGSLARTEKFNSPQFVSAITDILAACKESIFLYTGAEDSHPLRKAFEDRGLHNSAIYVGWVDTELYSQTLDVFLETFPFGCGVTGAQAVDSGTKTISLWCNETLPRYYYKDFNEAKSACGHWTVVDTERDFIHAAITRCLNHNSNVTQSNEIGLLSRLDSVKSETFFRLITSDVARN
jgi:hypothetical protein